MEAKKSLSKYTTKNLNHQNTSLKISWILFLIGFNSMKRENLKKSWKSRVFSSRMDRLIVFSSMKREKLKNFTQINFSGGNVIMRKSIFWKEKNCEKINFLERHFLAEKASFQWSFSFSCEKPSCKNVETTVVASWRQIWRFSKSCWYIQWICFLSKETSIKKTWNWTLNFSRKMRQIWIRFLLDKRITTFENFTQEAL